MVADVLVTLSPAQTADVLRVRLPAAARDRLRDAFDELPAVEENLEALLAGLLQATAAMPRNLLGHLLRFRAAPDAPAGLLVSGMPIDEPLPATPTEPGTPVAGHVSGCSILLASLLLGEPVAYAGEKGGALVQHVFPTAGEAVAPSNESSGVDLGFHTELTFSDVVPEQSFDVAAPDFVLLLALRSPPSRSAVTSVLDARALCARLDADHLAVLREARFQLRAPHSFVATGGERPWSWPLALVRGPADAPRVAFDIACGVRAVDPNAAAALQALRDACADPELACAVTLAPGDLLAIDNTRCAHARSRYDARFDGGDRWLRRTYVRRDLHGLRPAGGASFRVLA
jgi:L-asparagine oxygenase